MLSCIPHFTYDYVLRNKVISFLYSISRKKLCKHRIEKSKNLQKKRAQGGVDMLNVTSHSMHACEQPSYDPYGHMSSIYRWDHY